AFIGVNIGRNKETSSSNSNQDYTRGIEKFGCIADYLVVNVSSPNTPKLRALQEASELEDLLSAIRVVYDRLPCRNNRPPLLLKVAPDLGSDEIKAISEVISKPKTSIDGLIVTNTTVQRPLTLKSENKIQTGGLSGEPLKSIALETIRLFRQYTKGKIPLIGVGGISTAEDILERIKAGASLIQIYTSLTYSGPPIVNKLNRELAKLIRNEGFSSVAEAVGIDVDSKK
ncbi:unnamed protein product, partial [Didymodactylos carnosus]